MRTIPSFVRSVGIVGVVGAIALLAGCGSDDDGPTSGRATVVVTTSVWGGVVDDAFGDVVDVQVVVPVGADPHDFAPSARQAELMENADLLVVNGVGLEEAMDDVVTEVERAGTPVFEMAASVPVIDGDPHVWMDPTRVGTALGALAVELAELPGVDRGALDDAVASATAELAELDREVESELAVVPAERRVLLTGHDAFAYFADRYGFEVLGSVVPSNTTGASVSAAGLEELAAAARERDIPAIFVESVQSDDLARALAAEIGSAVEVVELFTETVGDAESGADSYAGMLRVDARRIAAALG